MNPRPATLALALLAGASAFAQATPPSELDDLLATRVSSASKLEQTSMRAPASMTIVTADEIARHGYRTLDELLESVAGLYLSYDRNYAYVGVRGFSRPTDYNTRVLLLVDGHRLNEEVYGMASIGTDLPIDLRAIERVEVVRGPGSAAFGSSAMLAVVNRVLRAPRDAADETVGALELGGFGRAAAGVRGARSWANGAGLAWSTAAFSSAGSDLRDPGVDPEETPGDRIRGTDWDRGRGATLRASWRKLELTALATARDKGIPTGAFDSDLGDRRAATRDDWLLVGLDWRQPLAHGWTVATHASLNHYAYDGAYPSDGVLYLDSTDSVSWRFEAQATWEPRADSRLSFGFETRRAERADYRSFDDAGQVYFDGDFPGWSSALYVEQEFQLSEKLIVTLGLRHDDPSGADARTTPRLALVYLPDHRDSLKLLYGSAFRAPDVYELGYEDPPSGVVSNPDLEAESIESLEAVWERRLSSTLFGSLSAYRYKMRDLIEQRADPETGLLQFRNVGSATSRGVELELSARYRSGLTGTASFSWQHATDDDGRRLSNSPARLAKLGVSRALGRGLRASASLLWDSGRRTLDGQATDAFLRGNAILRWQLGARPWALELQIRNFTDAGYSYPGGLEHRQPALEQDGRSWTLRAEYRF